MRRIGQARRTVAAVVSPFLVEGALTVGRGLGWTHRHLTRLAAASDGPAWFPPAARTMAAGVARLMSAGRWLSRRRAVSAWMLRHRAAAFSTLQGRGSARAGQRLVALAAAPTAKPSRPIRILNPFSPAGTLGALMGASHIDELAELFDQFVGQYEPESVNELTGHLEAFAPLFEAFAGSFARLAERLQDDYEVEPTVIDTLQQLGSANAGMTDLCLDVLSTWRTQQEGDLARHENPRANESEFWNYKDDE